MQKFKETGDSRYIYQNKLEKTCFQRDNAYGDFRDLLRTAASDKVLHDKAFNIAKNPKFDGYQRGLASVVYDFFDKNSTSLTDKSASGGVFQNEVIPNQHLSDLAVELNKQIIKKFEKIEVSSSFKGNICGTALADMQLISKFNKGIHFLLCVIDIYSKYG